MSLQKKLAYVRKELGKERLHKVKFYDQVASHANVTRRTLYNIATTMPLESNLDRIYEALKGMKK